MSFTRPKALAYKFAPASKAELYAAVRDALANFPETVDEQTLSFLLEKATQFDVMKLNHVHSQMSPFRSSNNPLSIALSNFVEAQDIVPLFRSPFTFDPRTPAQAERIFRWAAKQLHGYGHVQAGQLLGVAQRVLAWCKTAQISRVHIIDSPLGGSFPAEVLSRVLKEAGIEASIEEFLAPRLGRHSQKHSVRDAAKDLAARLKDDSRPVIFMDEVLTGTRFTKLFDALEKNLHERLIPIALVLTQPPKGRSREFKKLHDRLVDIRRRRRIPTLHEFAQLPYLNIDNGPPFQSSNKFYWADLDLCAGKRKVNLVFALLHTLQETCNALLEPTSPAMQHLIHLWSFADDDQQYEGHGEILKQSIPSLVSKLDWEMLLARARVKFPADYKGNPKPEPSEAWAMERINWILDSIAEQAHPGFKETNSPNKGWMIRRALEDLYAYYSGQQSTRMPRDRDFAEYTLRFESPHRSFHEELVELCLNVPSRSDSSLKLIGTPPST